MLAQQQYKWPSTDLSDTFTNIAKMRAYQQAARLEELKYGQLERSAARDEEFTRLAAGLFTQEPAAGPGPQGLAAGPPVAAAPAAPVPGGPPPAPSMAAQVPPAPPGQNYAMAPQFGATDTRQVAAPEYQRVPADLQSLATAPAPMSSGTPMPAQMRETPPAGPERGLAGAEPRTPPVGGPAAPPPSTGGPAPGLGEAQPRPASALLQPVNERVLMQLYAANPDKASKLMEGHLKMQEQKLTTSEKMNEQIRQTLSAVERSPDPAKYYPEAIKDLKARGIPIPDSFPMHYEPGLLRFKLMQHETLAEQLSKAKILHQEQVTATARAEELYKGAQAKREGTQSELDVAKTGAVPSEIAANRALADQRRTQAALDKARQAAIPADIRAAEALAEQRKAEATRVPTQIEADKALAAQRDAETALAKARTGGVATEISAAQALAEQRQAETRLKQLEVAQRTLGVPEYVKGEGAYNAALGEIVKREGTTGSPSAAQMQQARNQVVADKATVAASHGKDAASSAVIKDVLTNASAKGQSGEQVHSVLDDVEDLMSQGVLSSKWEEAWRMYAQSAGLRPDDEAAARTWAMQNLGEQLTLALAGGKLGGQVSDADRELIARAAGGMGKLLSPAQQKQAVEQLRRLADRDVEFGNRHIKQYNETKSLPEYGQVRKERLAKTITPAKFEEALAARPGIGREALRTWFADPANGYILRLN